MPVLNAATLWVPTLLILIGILLNRADYHSLRVEFRNEFNNLRGEFNGLRGEFNGLRGEFTALRSDVTTQIDAVKTAGHADALEIMRQMTALHERVAVVESKQNR